MVDMRILEWYIWKWSDSGWCCENRFHESPSPWAQPSRMQGGHQGHLGSGDVDIQDQLEWSCCSDQGPTSQNPTVAPGFQLAVEQMMVLQSSQQTSQKRHVCPGACRLSLLSLSLEEMICETKMNNFIGGSCLCFPLFFSSPRSNFGGSPIQVCRRNGQDWLYEDWTSTAHPT